MKRRALGIALVLCVFMASLASSSSPQHDSEEDFFRLKPLDASSNSNGKKPAVVNPKKSTLPVGPAVIEIKWNHTEFAYFGGWGQVLSADVHHFHIDTEAIALQLDEASRKKPVYLQLRQKSTDKVHVELFMSNGEYPTPAKHKFSCNTRDSQSVHIKLRPFAHSAQWLIRVQPSEPLSVWSKSLEYSLHLYERESETDTFSETWEGFLVTFVLVLGSTIGIVFYFRSIKNQEAKLKAQLTPNSSFFNLNSDQQLMSLTEAQERAKQRQLVNHDSVSGLGRAQSSMEISRVVDDIIRKASPTTNQPDTHSSPASLQTNDQQSSPLTKPATQHTTTANAGSKSSAAPAPSAAKETVNSAVKAPITTKPNVSGPISASVAPIASKGTGSGSNVKKMTAFWDSANSK